MSEVVGTVLLTAVSVMLIGGFGATVLLTAQQAESGPEGAFALDPYAGERHVDVRFVTGTAFPLAGAVVALGVNGTGAAADPYLLAGDDPALFAPGDVLRVNLTPEAPTPGPGTRFQLLIGHRESGDLIGMATATLGGGGTQAPLALGRPSAGTLTLSPSSVRADGAAIGNATLAVGHTYGLALVRSVTLDLSPFGGPSALALADGGGGGDALPGDGVYSAQFSLPVRNATRVANVTATVTDVRGVTATASAQLTATKSGAGTVKAGPGSQWQDVPASEDVGGVNLSRFLFHDDIGRLERDLAWLRITDSANRSRWWDAYVRFEVCDGRAAVKEVELLSWNTASSSTYAPTRCFPLDSDDASLTVSDPGLSLDASGASATWTRTGDAAGNLYGATEISGANVAAMLYFTDETSPSPNQQGLLLADFDFTYRAGSGGGGGSTPGATTWFACPGTVSPGTLADCARLRSDTDGGAAATLTEEKVAGKHVATAEFTGTVAGASGTTHTLFVRARQVLAPEPLHLQVWDGAAWNTAATVASTSFATTAGYGLSAAEWNGGAPRVRFVDATGLTDAVDRDLSTWELDWVKVVSS